jgi:hypothetical protein
MVSSLVTGLHATPSFVHSEGEGDKLVKEKEIGRLSQNTNINKGAWTYVEPLKKFMDLKIQFKS